MDINLVGIVEECNKGNEEFFGQTLHPVLLNSVCLTKIFNFHFHEVDHSLVQQLQQAKLQLQLQSMLKKLDRFDLLALDDLGYVKKTEAETSVLFELIAHRYERRSLLITANQPFSQ